MIETILNKKILFIGIGFYDYEQAILTLLKKEGGIVHYINSSQTNFFIRLLNRLKLNKAAISYQKDIRIKNIVTYKDNDIVFIIKGENLTQSDISLLKEKNPNANFILYLWDSLIRLSNKDILLKNFENIWSFDRVDCVNNPQLKFRPLFYREIYPIQQKETFISFIGWWHSDRLEMLHTLKGILQSLHKTFFFKIYTGRINYLMQKYVSRNIESKDKELFIFKPLTYEQVKKINAGSVIVIDWAHPLQSGLTMRTIEALAQGCYLVTNNDDIINYPEINPELYFIIKDIAEIKQICNLILEETKVSEDFYDRFSIERFLKDIFS